MNILRILLLLARVAAKGRVLIPYELIRAVDTSIYVT